MASRASSLTAAAIALAVALTAPALAAGPAGDAAHGKIVFASRCGLCHSGGPGVGEAGQGPALAGVVGRHAASEPGFDYTDALKTANLVWTPANLDRWLAGPSKMVPGTTMPVAVSDAKTRADLVAYLATTR